MATTCSMSASEAFFSITMTMRSPLIARRSLPLHAARFVDDSFEKTADGGGIERAAGRLLHVQQHLLFALRRVNGQAQVRLDLADLDGVLRALIEQSHDDFIDAVDGVAKAGKLELCVLSIHNKKPLARTGRGLDRLTVGAPSRGAHLPTRYVKKP